MPKAIDEREKWIRRIARTSGVSVKAVRVYDNLDELISALETLCESMEAGDASRD